MGVKVAVFEDDKDVADLIKEMMETKNFEVVTYDNLKDVNWHSCDIVLGDFRNRIVAFKALQQECSKRNVPLVAISGTDTDYVPQLIKPFSIEDLQTTVLDTLLEFKLNEPTKNEVVSDGMISTMFRKSS